MFSQGNCITETNSEHSFLTKYELYLYDKISVINELQQALYKTHLK